VSEPRQQKIRLLLCKGSGRAVFYGELTGTRPHEHHAVELFIGLDGPVSLHSERAEIRSSMAIVDSDFPHRARPCGSSMAVVMIDPESTAAKNARSAFLRGRRSADACETADHRALAAALPRGEDPDFGAFEACLDGMLGLSAPEGRPEGADARMRDVRRYLNALDVKRISLERVASAWNLSASRLLHLFSKETGIPFRRYQLWLRLIDAVEGVIGGKGLTEAAHAAGFSDYAHFSRTFSRMFGYSLSAIFRKKAGVEIFMR
jgi:AraC-like DNA-binding protein